MEVEGVSTYYLTTPARIEGGDDGSWRFSHFLEERAPPNKKAGGKNLSGLAAVAPLRGRTYTRWPPVAFRSFLYPPTLPGLEIATVFWAIVTAFWASVAGLKGVSIQQWG